MRFRRSLDLRSSKSWFCGRRLRKLTGQPVKLLVPSFSSATDIEFSRTMVDPSEGAETGEILSGAGGDRRSYKGSQECADLFRGPVREQVSVKFSDLNDANGPLAPLAKDRRNIVGWCGFHHDKPVGSTIRLDFPCFAFRKIVYSVGSPQCRHSSRVARLPYQSRYHWLP
ncbi:hypothetical protein BJX63DRAFT_236133 [Aspergillus granulosus]|uniref:Uncharacterized protein n=1 Tax=Aspergillus granulosus TaxID=176169 RepID=A0ABR4HBR5_9EURO